MYFSLFLYLLSVNRSEQHSRATTPGLESESLLLDEPDQFLESAEGASGSDDNNVTGTT